MIEQDILTEVEKIARECGEAMLEAGKAGYEVAEKTSKRDLVTSVDNKNQDKIINYLSKKFPEAGFFSEESAGDILPNNELVFVIDPIDGTTNFTKDLKYSCVSIACFKNMQPYVSVVYEPYNDEMFTAILGQGAFCNGERMTISHKPLEESLVVFGTSPYFPEVLDKTVRRLKEIMPECSDVRRMGAAALDLCYIAAGRFGLYFEDEISLWDYAAGALIVREAGGKICQLDGQPLTFGIEKSSILAGTEKNIQEYLIIERRHEK